MNVRQIARTAGVLLIAVLLGYGLPLLAARSASAVTAYTWPSAKPHGHSLAWLFVQHGVKAALALISIAVLRRFMTADFGLRLPRRAGEVATAALWALAICALFT